MEYTIAHTTTYVYPEPISESYAVVHLKPRSDPNQFCTRYELEVAPRATVFSYADRFGNDAQHFAVLPTHDRLSITARSNVATTPPEAAPRVDEATRALLDADGDPDAWYAFLRESQYVRFTAPLDEFLKELGPPGERIGTWCSSVAAHVHRTFSYDKAATTVRSAVDDALATRAGVCQDFAHVMIAAARNAKIPARYVSGYIFRGDSHVLGAEASHAWCEAYLPPSGWIGFDPTNDRLVDDHYVKIAIGRAYRDVSPVRGVYRGSADAEMSVDVAMEALANQQ